MLTVYRSNRAEFLAQLLATQLLQDRPGPFEQVQVVVNTWPTSRWLGEQLAIHLGGIAANLRFPFPASRLREIVEQVLAAAGSPSGEAAGLEPIGSDAWRANLLVWPLLGLLPQIAAAPEGEPLARWLAERSPGGQLELGTWQLGRAIADAFDDYGLYRPELLRRWDGGQACDCRDEALPPSQQWQPLLYRELRRRLPSEPFGLRVERAIELLRRNAALGNGMTLGESVALQIPGPLRLFGLSSLAPVQVRLLQALSGSLPVDLFLLTPCDDLWQRCEDRRRRLSDALALHEPLDADWLLQAPGLEARVGRLGAEFQQLLEGTGEAQLGTWRERDLFLRAATASTGAAGGGPPGAPLLAQLQEQLIAPELLPSLHLAPGDHSLEFHPCPGPLRQVQIVRDRLLQLMADDDSLEPRDILVMTPQVDRFAPLIASVFGDSEATGVNLPWRLTDRSLQSVAGIGRTLLALLRLGGERLTASALETLLDCRPLQQHFGLSGDEASRLHGVLQRCGFRWGLDGRDRGGDPSHSLSWTIDRLLLGLVLPDSPGLALGELVPVAPAASGTSLELSGRWLHLLLRLRHWLDLLGRSCDCRSWGERLRSLLEDLFGDGGDDAWEVPAVLAVIDDWLEAAEGCDLLLEAPVVAAVLDEGLAADSGRFGHRSGALTISALEPMRAIPHRVIVLMGLDAGSFPRQRNRPGFHLLEQQRQLGDPHPADQDRYVLMEALLSARSHLLISWSCRDDRSGEPLPPAAPVRQWLEWLRTRLPNDHPALLMEHPASPLDPAAFRPAGERPPASCDRRQLRARRALESGAQEPPRGLAFGPMPAPGRDPGSTAEPSDPAESGDPGERFEELRLWLMEPQKQWLRQLGLRAGEWELGIDDLEALELGEHQRAGLLRAVQAEALEWPEAAPERPQDWLERSRGQGLLPPLAGAELEARTLDSRWSSLRGSLDALGHAWFGPLQWGPWRGRPQWQGDTVVLVHTGKEGAPQRLDLWLQLLLAAAAAQDSGRTPSRGVVIARLDQRRFGPGTELRAPGVEQARAELERLAALRQQWQTACWPVPPRSGWAWLEAELQEPGSGLAKARDTWEGGQRSNGEREREEMVVCFGADLSAATLWEGDAGERVRELLTPLFETLARPEKPVRRAGP